MSISNPPADALELAIAETLAGKPIDPKAAERAVESLAKGREEIRKRVGEVDVLALIRESRDG